MKKRWMGMMLAGGSGSGNFGGMRAHTGRCHYGGSDKPGEVRRQRGSADGGPGRKQRKTPRIYRC